MHTYHLTSLKVEQWDNVTPSITLMRLGGTCHRSYQNATLFSCYNVANSHNPNNSKKKKKASLIIDIQGKILISMPLPEYCVHTFSIPDVEGTSFSQAGRWCPSGFPSS